MDSKVVGAAAEAQLSLLPAVVVPARPRARSAERAWARAEHQAHFSYLEAKESGDAGLIERTRRAWLEVWHAAPARQRRRAREGSL